MKKIKTLRGLYVFLFCLWSISAISQKTNSKAIKSDAVQSKVIQNPNPPNPDPGDGNGDPLLRYFRDYDKDGWGDPENSKISQTRPSGYVGNNQDCNDNNASITIPRVRGYYDKDDDGYGDKTRTRLFCSTAAVNLSGSYSVWGTDCDDNNASINPGTVWYLDADNDGFAGSTKNQCTSPGVGYTRTIKPLGDCDDSNASINPNTKWYLDADNDGFASIIKTQCSSPGTGYSTTVKPTGDCNDSNASTNPNTKWYLDADNDGFASTIKTQCANPGAGYSITLKPTGDCNDSNASIHPNTIWYKDSDGDGFAASTVTQCASPGTGYGAAYKPIGDCNDSNASINPNTKWYADTDGDGFGDPSSFKTQCTQPAGYVSNNTDKCPAISGPHSGCVDTPYQATNFSNENYIYTRSYQVPMTNSSGIIFNKDVIENITYFDGLGRPKQSIGIKQAPNEKDIITHIDYDDFGRQAKDWLPYYEPNGNLGTYRGNKATATQDYYRINYADDFPGITTTNLINAYSKKEFEASPLNRVTKQGAPGKDWKLGSGHEIEFDYNVNTANEVQLFKVTLATDYTPSLTGNSTVYYNAGQLYKTITRDENHNGTTKNHTTEEFKDKQGRVVLKRTYNYTPPSGETEGAHDTYYVYDIYGNLTYVIPPKVNTADGVSVAELNELCYQYQYDHRYRLVEKKIPGKGNNSDDWEEIVYNKLDQPILTRDPNLKSLGKALFTKYDAFGRVTYTGLMNVSGTITRSSLQTTANGFSAQYENKNAHATSYASTPVYYTKNAYPDSFDEVHTINYYDNYTFDLAGLTIPTGKIYEQDIAANVKGLATGSKVRVLGTNHWITTIMVYDEKGRPIYTASHNKYLGTTDIVETKLDFPGKVLESKTTHIKSGQNPIVTVDVFTYDHTGRLLTQIQSVNGGTPELIAENRYDNLGQLDQKKVGNNTATPLQIIDYTYNIRGWLKQINDPTNIGNKLFAFKIGYNEGSNPLYNGNIARTQWKTQNTDQSLKTYNYRYDPLNRITAATGGANTNYDVSNISYDKMGNIQSLTRNGWQDSATYTNMDVLDYDYDSGNKLLKVADTGNKAHGFKDGTNTNNDFEYDPNGNLKIDRNKGITGITYNHLNLPTGVTINNGTDNGIITYTYDASGAKLQKIVADNNTSSTTTTDYAGNYVYENSSLKFFNQAEGYVEPVNPNNYSAGFNYIYQYKDHLGNIRLSYKNIGTTGSPNLEILEENNYYPFGLEHKGYNNTPSPFRNSVASKYKYNGKELQDELGLNMYDYGARFYEPATGRWFTVDPLAEERQGLSPYNFVQNNPINRIDPDGALDESIQQPDDWIYNKETGQYVWDGNVTNASQTPEGFDYVGPSLKDVDNHFEDNNPIASFFTNPEMGENRTSWPGEIMAHENTVFENARDFGVENNIPGSETAYNILDDVSVFVTSFDLLNPKGQPLRLDGSVSVRGSSDHIDSGINGLMTVMPMPKFNISGFNMAQSNKFFKGTWYNKLSPNIKGKALKAFNFIMKKNVTPKKILKQTKSNAEKINN